MTGPILVVDDSLTVRMDLHDALAAAGFTVRPCATVAEARAVLAREPVALAILDVLLPDGDGVELLAEIRAVPERGELPVLMLSTEAEVGARVRGLRGGASDYVGKPYDTATLVARVRDLLRGRGDGEPPRAPVLLIDDSPTFRAALAGALAEAGHAVLDAADGETGLRVAAGARPAAIVVDGVMPGIDGATVVRRVRLDAALRATPCLLLTGSEDVGAELRALDAGADAFVRKEEPLEVILARIAALLRTGGAGASEGESLHAPKRILAVDDSPTYRHALADVLRQDGYDVVLAPSGEEALELLAAQPADCILMDLMMPGLGGRETCRRIKAAKALRDIPLLMLTAVEDRGAMIEGLGAGADDYIAKSADFDVLRARVRAQIRRGQFEREHRRVREELLRSELAAAEARAAHEAAEVRAALADELARKNRELEAFSYSVSHDLRAPLRGIDGFAQALVEDYADQLDDRGRDYLRRVRAGAQRMGEIIDDLLLLSRVSRAELRRARIDMSELARAVAEEIERRAPGRQVLCRVADGLAADADSRLLRVLLENLLGNAWKFTARTADARVEFGQTTRDGATCYFVGDNGAGFDMANAHKLFAPFTRLHGEADFPGTGIGLATVQRIVERHGGRVWAEGAVGQGAKIYFTLGGGPRPAAARAEEEGR